MGSKAAIAIAIVLVLISYLAGYYVGLPPYISELIGLSKSVSMSTSIVTEKVKETTTITKSVTQAVPVTKTKVITVTTTKQVPGAGKVLTTTATVVTTVVSTKVVTKELRVTSTVTKYKGTVTKYIYSVMGSAVIPSKEAVQYVLKSAPSLNPPKCPLVRRNLNETLIAAALSPQELLAVKKIAQQVLVAGDPLLTAERAAKWVHDNVKYLGDERFGVKNCVLMPSETLRYGGGDCEDLALLLASILLSTGELSKVYILEVNFRDTEVGHVDVGVDIFGTIYALMPEEYPFLRSLGSDYCGKWLISGLAVKNVTPYEVVLTSSGSVAVTKLKTVKVMCGATYPPPIGSDDLRYIEKYLSLTFNLNHVSVPKYIWEQYELLDKGITYLPYLRMTVPIDWFSKEPRDVLVSRIAQIVKDKFGKNVEELLKKHGCGVFKAVLAERKIKVTKFDKNLRRYETVEKRPVIDVYLILPYKCPAPRTDVEVSNGKIVISTESLGRSVEVLIYKVHESSPILGITKPGWVYSGVPAVVADKWVSRDGVTYIEVSLYKVRSKLGSGKYVLLVWVDKEVAYVKYLKLS